MAKISAADVKALREQTGAGMLDCKKALEESDGDLTAALEYIRVKGLKGVEKRESRTASNGLVAAAVEGGAGTMIELNCETDFVAKGEAFGQAAEKILAQAVASGATSADELLKSSLADGKTVQELVDEVNASIGEKIVLRRVARVEGSALSVYLHRTSPDLPPQVGVLVGLDAENAIGRDIAMHIAALPPEYLTREDVPEEVVATERRIAEETAREEGKPEQALPRIIEGRVSGFFKDKVLLEQKFAKDQSKTVEKVASEAGVKVTGFARFRVGA